MQTLAPRRSAIPIQLLCAAAALVSLVSCTDDGPEGFALRRLDEARARSCASGDTTVQGRSPGERSPLADDDLVVAFEELQDFHEPVDLAVRRGDDDSVFVLEKAGQVYDVPVDGSTASLVGDLSALFDTVVWDPAGALGLEFSPDGRFAYVHYVDRSDHSVIAEFVVAADGAIVTTSERQLLRIQQHIEAWHYGGDLAFGDDGMLFVALGDGDSGTAENGGDPERHANDPYALQGSILRIDPAASPSAPYSVPADNPFASGELGAPEVWAWGLRNPWKFAFDRTTGDLWVADVGYSTTEEASVVRRTGRDVPGRCVNFGWSEFEGDSPLNRGAHGPGRLVFPVVTYGHDVGCSIAGAAVYRGSSFESLVGSFIYSDLCAGELWAYDPSADESRVLANDVGAIVAVREGPDGELFVIDHTGPILRVVPT